MMFRIDLPLWLCLIIPRGGNKGRCSTLNSSFIWLGEDRGSQSESLTTEKNSWSKLCVCVSAESTDYFLWAPLEWRFSRNCFNDLPRSPVAVIGHRSNVYESCSNHPKGENAHLQPVKQIQPQLHTLMPHNNYPPITGLALIRFVLFRPPARLWETK